MAKMKIHELAKELDVSSKEVITFLNDKGMEVKSHMSSIEDDAIALVKKQFGKQAEKPTEKKEEKPEVKAEAPKTEETKAEAPKAEASKVGAPKTDAKPEAAKTGEAPKKKKNIIFVSNMQNSSMQQRNGNRPQNGGNRPNGGNGNNGQRPGNGKPVIQQQQQYRPLPKPVIKPAVLPSYEEEFGVPEKAPVAKQQENRKDGFNRNDNRDNRGGNRNDGRNENRGDFKNNRNDDRRGNGQNYAKSGNGERRQGGYHENRQDNRGGDGSREANRDNKRPFGNNERPNRGDGKPGNNNFRKPSSANKGFVPDAPIKEQEKHRDEEKRRQSQERDKRSKKDHLYEDDEMMGQKGKMNKPGRFIKPEKKVEEKEEEQIKVIVIPENLTIKDLADKMKIQPSAIVKKLFMQGQIVTVNQEISYETAEEIAMEYEILCEKEVKVDIIEELLKEEEEDEATLTQRPPVICVMGHVDHGKTSLLDAIRKTNVTDREAGGITQHIGAYTVTANGQKITFLDTPGHEAFTAMRMRGANSTDIAVLVVAADDGVMPQTIEAINHAKAAGIEIIVAVNKIDKPNANIDRVKQELTEYELIPVDWGGSTEFVPVSAKSGEGIADLLETIILTAEILELKANPNRKARGLVIEAELDKGRGPVATVLVQKGTLKVGDFISAGAAHGKVRAMIDDKGRRVKEATPSTPVEILGLSDVPNAGEIFIAHNSDKEARNFAETFIAQNKEKKLEETKAKMSLDDLFTKIQEGNLKELNLIIKADVQGSVEAVKQSLVKLSNEEVVVKCIHGGVGAINESDVSLAAASSAIIIGFNVRPDVMAKATAEREGVDVRLYKVIYQAIEDVEAAMKGMLDPVYEEQVIGHAEVRQLFKASAVGNIAGSYVLDGRFDRGCKVRISRGEEQIYEGELASLKRFKDDVKEVKAGFECGLVFEGFDQMQEGDIVEAYIMVEVPR